MCDSEESRLTERHKWIPWVGIGIAAVTIIYLFAHTVHEMRKEDDIETDSDKTKTN